MASLSVSENQFLNIGTSDAAEGDLRRAVVEGRIADVYDLLAMGTVCRGDPDNKWGPMHLAALHGWPEIVKLLCDAGASLESLSYRKNTPLCVAAWASTGTRLKFRDIAVPSSRQVEVARILISNGANIEAANYRLNRPLHIIAGNCDMDGSIAELLLEAGAERSPYNFDGNTPLHCAARCGNIKVARLLVQKGANLEVNFPGLLTLSYIDRVLSHLPLLLFLGSIF